MVTTGSTYGHYSGRTNHTLTLSIQRAAVQGNQSYFNWQLVATRNSGSVSYGLDCYAYSVWVAGQNWTGCHNLDFRNTATITVASGYTQWVTHDGNGELNIWIDASHTAAPSVMGNADTAGTWLAIDRIGSVPGAPTLNTIWDVSTTYFQVNWNIPSDNGSAINAWEHQWDDDPAFPNPLVWQDIWNGHYTNPRGQVALNPGTTYYVRAHARNGIGWGPFGPTVSQTTIPATPPGMTVTPNGAGTSAQVFLTPPGGVSGVTYYVVERRLIGTTAATTTTGASPHTIGSLIPGATYEWRSSAMIGTYQSPWTAWVPIFQPNPNTNPGDFFDGSSTDKPDIDYGWSGAASNSTSTATGKGVTGWSATFAHGSVGVMYQATGGYSRTFAARVQITADATSAGAVDVGVSPAAGFRAAVAESALYVGSIWVNPSRSQRLQARLFWFNAAGAQMSSSTGVPELVGGNSWTRLAVSATSPVGAVTAVIRVWDAAGEGWSAWKGGDSLRADAAMITLGVLVPYFDGSFPDDKQYAYAWVSTPDASASTRTNLVQTQALDPLDDPDCPAPPAPPRPPIVPDECIKEFDTWRRYWATIPAERVSDWLTVLPTVEFATGCNPDPVTGKCRGINQVRIRVYANPFGYPIGIADTSTWCAEQIISYIPPKTIMTLDGVTQRVWADVDGAGTRSADHLLYGTDGAPATWPSLTCGISYLMSLDLPLDSPAVTTIPTRLMLTQRM